MRNGLSPAVALLASLLLAACAAAPSSSTAARAGFGMHLAQSGPVPGAMQMTWRGQRYALQPQSIVDDSDVQDVQLGADGIVRPVIRFTMTKAAAKRIRAVTRDNIGNDMCFTFGDEIINCATIQSAFGDRFLLSFSSFAEAHDQYVLLTGDDGR